MWSGPTPREPPARHQVEDRQRRGRQAREERARRRCRRRRCRCTTPARGSRSSRRPRSVIVMREDDHEDRREAPGAHVEARVLRRDPAGGNRSRGSGRPAATGRRRRPRAHGKERHVEPDRLAGDDGIRRGSPASSRDRGCGSDSSASSAAGAISSTRLDSLSGTRRNGTLHRAPTRCSRATMKKQPRPVVRTKRNQRIQLIQKRSRPNTRARPQCPAGLRTLPPPAISRCGCRSLRPPPGRPRIHRGLRALQHPDVAARPPSAGPRASSAAYDGHRILARHDHVIDLAVRIVPDRL